MRVSELSSQTAVADWICSECGEKSGLLSGRSCSGGKGKLRRFGSLELRGVHGRNDGQLAGGLLQPLLFEGRAWWRVPQAPKPSALSPESCRQSSTSSTAAAMASPEEITCTSSTPQGGQGQRERERETDWGTGHGHTITEKGVCFGERKRAARAEPRPEDECALMIRQSCGKDTGHGTGRDPAQTGEIPNCLRLRSCRELPRAARARTRRTR